MKKKQAILIFRKNEILGQVKTRIAKDTNENIALEIYKQLCDKTVSTCAKSTFELVHYYSHYTPEDCKHSQNRIQCGEDLGERMHNALEESFVQYDKLILVGTDCPYLTPANLTHAMDLLDRNDVVLGPCTDGGYYLIGLKKIHPLLFKNIDWSTEKVLNQSLAVIQSTELKYELLQVYSDVDTLKDWLNYLLSKKSTGQ